MSQSPAIQGLDPRIWQAIIAGGFIALGWVVTNYLNRRAAARLRSERLRDVHRAIFAEIGHNLSNLGEAEDLEAQRDVMLDKMLSEDGFVPLIPRERNDAIFRSIVDEIHILPRETIDPIVAYYSQLAALDALVDDMRGASFKTISPRRRAEMYKDYIALKLQAKAYGDHALQMIDDFPDDVLRRAWRSGAESRKARRRVNSPGADPSGR